jgi:hypothetical protein
MRYKKLYIYIEIDIDNIEKVQSLDNAVKNCNTKLVENLNDQIHGVTIIRHYVNVIGDVPTKFFYHIKISSYDNVKYDHKQFKNMVLGNHKLNIKCANIPSTPIKICKANDWETSNEIIIYNYINQKKEELKGGNIETPKINQTTTNEINNSSLEKDTIKSYQPIEGDEKEILNIDNSMLSLKNTCHYETSNNNNSQNMSIFSLSYESSEEEPQNDKYEEIPNDDIINILDSEHIKGVITDKSIDETPSFLCESSDSITTVNKLTNSISEPPEIINKEKHDEFNLKLKPKTFNDVPKQHTETPNIFNDVPKQHTETPNIFNNVSKQPRNQRLLIKRQKVERLEKELFTEVDSILSNNEHIFSDHPHIQKLEANEKELTKYSKKVVVPQMIDHNNKVFNELCNAFKKWYTIVDKNKLGENDTKPITPTIEFNKMTKNELNYHLKYYMNSINTIKNLLTGHGEGLTVSSIFFLMAYKYYDIHYITCKNILNNEKEIIHYGAIYEYRKVSNMLDSYNKIIYDVIKSIILYKNKTKQYEKQPDKLKRYLVKLVKSCYLIGEYDKQAHTDLFFIIENNGIYEIITSCQTMTDTLTDSTRF